MGFNNLQTDIYLRVASLSIAFYEFSSFNWNEQIYPLTHSQLHLDPASRMALLQQPALHNEA